MTAVDVAEQMDGIGKVAGSMRAGGLEQGRNVGMTDATAVGDPRKLRLRYADWLAFGLPVGRHGDRHSLRKIIAGTYPVAKSLTQGRKDEVYPLVTNG